MRFSFIISLFIGLLTGCGSSQKDKCESANWYQRGYSVAKKGSFPDGDFYLKRCKKAGADIDYQQLDVGFKKGREEICDPKVAKQYGLDGKQYEFPICMNFNESVMQRAYQSGLATFCTSTQLYKLGASGDTYNNVCQTNSEKLLESYQSGRKKYLSTSRTNEENKLATINKKISELEKKRAELKKQLDTSRMHQDQRARVLSEYRELGFALDNQISNRNQTEKQLNQLRAE